MLMKFTPSARKAGAVDQAGALARPGMIGDEDEIRAEKLVRIARKRLSDAVGEESDARNRSDGDDERHREHAQLARARQSREHAQRLLHDTILPAARRTTRPQRAASVSSCVTMTSVVPYSRFISKRSRITSAPDSASRLPVGSSARSSWAHDEARERDALLLAAREVPRIVVQPLAQSHPRQDAAGELIRLRLIG